MTSSLSIQELTAWLRRSAEALSKEADWLTSLDSAIGDADHGTNMARGGAAVIGKLDKEEPESISLLLRSAGMTLITSVGGASGSLYGTFFLEMAKHTPSEATMSAEDLESALRAGIAGVVARGHAQVGDKTMIDALDPAADALSLSLARGLPLHQAVATAAAAARNGREATKPLVARKGRASYLGERSSGHVDPGAASATILVEALSQTLAGAES